MQSFTRVRPGHILLAVAGLFVAGAHPRFLRSRRRPRRSRSRIFQNLPPEQQQAILEAMGSQAGPGALEQRRHHRAPRRAHRDRLPGVDAQPDRRGGPGRARRSTGEPRLKPDDTLIVEILPLQWEGQERVLTLRTQTIPQPTLARQACGRRRRSPSDNDAGTVSAPRPAGCRVDRARRSRDCEARAPDRHRAARQSLPRDALRHARSARARPDPGRGVDAVRGDAAADRREAAAGLPDPADAVAARARAQALRPRPVHDAPSDLRAGHGISRCRSIMWSGRAIDSRSSSSATPRARYSLIVNRDGNISFPELGPIAVSGLRFEDARSQIQARVAEQMIGTQASVCDGRSALDPGVRGGRCRAARVLHGQRSSRRSANALFASGGVKPIGSLRNIQLKRNGKLVQTPGPLRPAAEGRHLERCPPAAGRRDLRAAGGCHGGAFGRGPPTGHLRAEG